MEMVVFLAVFVIGGLIATKTMGVTETLPIFYLLKWCFSLFLTMLPCIGTMWAITVLFEKPLLSVGLNLLLVIPGVLVANTPLWIAYPYCYSGYLVSCSLHDFTAEASDAAFSLFPFLPCAVLVFCLVFSLAITQLAKKRGDNQKIRRGCKLSYFSHLRRIRTISRLVINSIYSLKHGISSFPAFISFFYLFFANTFLHFSLPLARIDPLYPTKKRLFLLTLALLLVKLSNLVYAIVKLI